MLGIRVSDKLRKLPARELADKVYNHVAKHPFVRVGDESFPSADEINLELIMESIYNLDNPDHMTKREEICYMIR